MPNKEKKPTIPEYKPNELLNDPVPRTENLSGLFSTVATVPTGVARKLHEQLRIFNNGVYIYDATNDQWLQIAGATPSIYSARFSSTASKDSGSSILSAATGATGIYTVTHNLAHTSYSVTATLVNTGGAGNGGRIIVVSVGSTTFLVHTYDAGGTAADSAFNVIIHDHS
jgi:hypothetical protein